MTRPRSLPPLQDRGLTTLLDALGVPVDDREMATLVWLAGWDPDAVDRIARMIRRSRRPAVWSEQTVRDAVTNVLQSLRAAGHDSLADDGGRDDVRAALAAAGIEAGAIR